ncbi:MAG: 16S rRNA (adenine(1518)-N(6)/adenine(1519)-N(6))-dimethyltransferase RsmA, partial [Xanthomonadales bacterium]|nr:16S rRNA (adenine(1518)-N(6)/adenine(1519)-N(6))-dimethyltransferase RsmA [Xanthomonadales bacterium]
TRPLLESGADLHVIEIDRDLAAQLPSRVPGLDPQRVHVGDALKTDIASLVPASPDQPLRVVGNLPYNISTPLLVRLLEASDVIRDMHFMLQKEVVDRMAAAPGGRDYGRLSLLCQYRCEVVPLFTVAPGSFNPVPRVESAFVRLAPHPQPPVEIVDHAAFNRLVTQAFSQRRKTLANSLKPLMPASLIRAAGIDPGLRAEAISLEGYAALAKVMAH